MDESHREYHLKESARIQQELDSLGPEFSEDGPVRWVLQQRINQEKNRAACCDGCDYRSDV